MILNLPQHSATPEQVGYGDDVVYEFGKTVDDRKQCLEGAKRRLQENLTALTEIQASAAATQDAMEDFAAVWLEEALRTLKWVSATETHYAISKGGWVSAAKALEHQEGPAYALEFWGRAREFAAELVRRAIQLPEDVEDWTSSFVEAAEDRVRQAERDLAKAERDLVEALEGAE